jgi:hypothetical protein
MTGALKSGGFLSMAVALALLESADPTTVQQFSGALHIADLMRLPHQQATGKLEEILGEFAAGNFRKAKGPSLYEKRTVS